MARIAAVNDGLSGEAPGRIGFKACRGEGVDRINRAVECCPETLFSNKLLSEDMSSNEVASTPWKPALDGLLSIPDVLCIRTVDAGSVEESSCSALSSSNNRRRSLIVPLIGRIPRSPCPPPFTSLLLSPFFGEPPNLAAARFAATIGDDFGCRGLVGMLLRDGEWNSNKLSPEKLVWVASIGPLPPRSLISSRGLGAAHLLPADVLLAALWLSGACFGEAGTFLLKLRLAARRAAAFELEDCWTRVTAGLRVMDS